MKLSSKPHCPAAPLAALSCALFVGALLLLFSGALTGSAFRSFLLRSRQMPAAFDLGPQSALRSRGHRRMSNAVVFALLNHLHGCGRTTISAAGNIVDLILSFEQLGNCVLATVARHFTLVSLKLGALRASAQARGPSPSILFCQFLLLGFGCPWQACARGTAQ